MINLITFNYIRFFALINNLAAICAYKQNRPARKQAAPCQGACDFGLDLLGRVFTFRKSDRQHHLSRAKYSPSHLAVGQVLR